MVTHLISSLLLPYIMILQTFPLKYQYTTMQKKINMNKRKRHKKHQEIKESPITHFENRITRQIRLRNLKWAKTDHIVSGLHNQIKISLFHFGLYHNCDRCEIRTTLTHSEVTNVKYMKSILWLVFGHFPMAAIEWETINIFISKSSFARAF
jgi:hypothetical protein